MTTETPVAVGPDLDALVAERVMGWREVWIEPRSGRARGHAASNRIFDVPPHSTDIAAAWRVVGKLADLTLWEGGGHWNARFGIDSWDDTMSGDTVPEAICRAALKAVAG